MSRLNIKDILYSREKSPLEFNFDALMAPGLLQFLSMGDIDRLYNIASSIRYASNLRYKKTEIRKIMEPRGFRHFASGTNRTVYRPLEYPPMVTKIALDEQGLRDNPAEFENQSFLKPFVTKVFENVPSGVIASFERVNPITTILEFESIAPDYFDMLVNKIIGKYVVADVGTNYFMNVGVRNGLGPVLLDFSYVYEIDGAKLMCCAPASPGSIELCGGLIDYDDGFNNLVCQKCGRIYNAKDLRKENHGGIKIVKEGEDIPMNIQICKGNEVIREIRSETDSIDFNPAKNDRPKLFRGETLVETVGDDEIRVNIISRKVPMTQKEISKERSIAARESAKNLRIAEFHAKQNGITVEEALANLAKTEEQLEPVTRVVRFEEHLEEEKSEEETFNVSIHSNQTEKINTLEKPYYMQAAPSVEDEETIPETVPEVETEEEATAAQDEETEESLLDIDDEQEEEAAVIEDDLYKGYDPSEITIDSKDDLGELESLGLSGSDFDEPTPQDDEEPYSEFDNDEAKHEKISKGNAGKY